MEKTFGAKIEEQPNSLESILKSRGLETPHLSFEFCFNSHQSKEDAEFVISELKGKDILIQENAAPDAERLQVFRDVSCGDLSASDAIARESERGVPFKWPVFSESLFDGLHGSGKEVVLADVPEDSETYQRLLALYRKDSGYTNLLMAPTYESALLYAKNFTKAEVATQRDREDYILKILPDEIEKLLKEKPELQKKEKLDILFSMGSYHTRLFQEMRKSGNDVSQKFQEMPYVYSPRTTIERKASFKGIDSIAEDLPKIVLIGILLKVMPYGDITADVVNMFSEDEIKDLYEKVKVMPDDEFRDYFQSKL